MLSPLPSLSALPTLVALPAACNAPSPLNPPENPHLHPILASQSLMQTAESGLVLLEGPCIWASLTKKINTSATHTNMGLLAHTNVARYPHGSSSDPWEHKHTHTHQPQSKLKTEGIGASYPPATHFPSFILLPFLQAVDHSKTTSPFPLLTPSQPPTTHFK